MTDILFKKNRLGHRHAQKGDHVRTQRKRYPQKEPTLPTDLRFFSLQDSVDINYGSLGPPSPWCFVMAASADSYNNDDGVDNY